MEKLIGEIVSDEQKKNDRGADSRFADQVKSVAAACASLKGRWVHELFSTVKEPVLTRYIQFHQAGIISLSDQISIRIPAAYFQGTEDQIYHLYHVVVSNIEELLEFLQRGFYKYFDSDHVASIEHCRIQTCILWRC